MSLRNRVIGLAAIGAAALVLAPTAVAKQATISATTPTSPSTSLTTSLASLSAGEGCDAPSSQVFAPWGDNALYRLVDGGRFEAGAPGWSLTGATTVVRDLNDGIVSDGAADEYALELGPDAVAISPPICVTKDSVQFRFLSNVVGRLGNVPNLRVTVRYQGKDNKSFDLTSPAGLSSPSPAINLVAGQFADGTTISLKFRSLDKATVRVDDVYMDPRMH